LRNYNRRLAGQRVICERWYGRLKSRHRDDRAADTPLARRNVRLPEEVEDEGEFGNDKFVMDATISGSSGKRKLYGLSRSGILLACWSGVPGAVHDLTVARSNRRNRGVFGEGGGR